MIAYQKLQVTLGFQDKPLLTLRSTRNTQSPEGKVEPECSSLSGSRISIFFLNGCLSKMPHSNLKDRFQGSSSGIAKCPCGQPLTLHIQFVIFRLSGQHACAIFGKYLNQNGKV